MTDSVAVLAPGERVTDRDGNVVAGAVLKFFAAGTDTPKTVYSDADLSVALGVTVTCDAGGYPTSDGSAQVLIYTGTASYKIRAETLTGALLWEHPNVRGAVTVPTVSDAALPETPVVSRTSSYTVLTTDRGKIINADPTGGTFAISLPSAVTAGDGWRIGIRHAGADTTNVVTIRSTGGQEIGGPGLATATAFALTGLGHATWLTSDGAGWTAESQAPQLMGGSLPWTLIKDRLTAPPAVPVGGNRYIVNGTATGTWATLGFAEGDIAESDGNGSWLRYEPRNGYLAYVEDEELLTQWRTDEWVDLVGATAAQSSTLKHGIFLDRRTDGTVGGAATTGAWTTRTIQTTNINTLTDASLSSNGVTLVTGTYLVRGTAYFEDTDTCQLRIKRGASTYYYGLTGNAGADGFNLTVSAVVNIIAATDTVELEYYAQSSGSTNDLGRPAGISGNLETYAVLEIIDLASLQGPQGQQGAQGATGLDAAFPYVWSTSTSVADPGAGKLSINNAAPASATTLCISTDNGVGADFTAVINSWDTSTNTEKGRLRIHKEDAPVNFLEYHVTAVTFMTTYYELTVTHVGSGGSFSNLDNLAVLFVPAGDVGAAGTTVPDISGLTAITRPVFSADKLIVYDASATSHKSTLAGYANIDVPIDLFGALVESDTSAAALNTYYAQLAIDYAASVGARCVAHGSGRYAFESLKTRTGTHLVGNPNFVFAPCQWSSLAYGPVITITIASPAVVTLVAHGFSADQVIYFTTIGSLPTGVTAGTAYYVLSTDLTADTFKFSATPGGSAINTSGSQSGTHYVARQRAGGGGFIGNVFATSSATDMVQSNITLEGLVIDGADLPAVSRGYVRAATSTTMTLAPSASATDQYYRSQFIRIFTGTGATSTLHRILDYNGTTKVATISGWAAGTPDTGSYYIAGSNDNGIGFARGARKVRVKDNTVRNFPATWVGGGGGKGIQIELGAHDVVVSGNIVEDCGFGYSVQGDFENFGSPTNEDSSATAVVFSGNIAKRCETGALASGYDNEHVSDGTARNLSFLYDGIQLEDCGAHRSRPSAVGVKGGPIVFMEAANGRVENVVETTTPDFEPYPQDATVTVTIATPAVVSWTAHGRVAGDTFCFATTGALPTGITAGTTYYVISTGLGANSFQFSATSGGSAVNTSGSQSGTHYASVDAAGTVAAGLLGKRGSLIVGHQRNVKVTATATGDFDYGYVLTNPTFIGDDGAAGTNESGIPQNQYGFEFDLDFTGKSMIAVVYQDTSGGSADTNEVAGRIRARLSNGRHFYCVPSAASPCVITTTEEDGVTTVEHDLEVGDEVFLTATDAGTMMSGISENTIYYVSSAGLTSTQFQIEDSAAIAINTAATTVTITQANPAVVTWNAHGLPTDAPVVFATSGSLPGGGTLVAGTTYYVRSPATNTFQVSATPGGASISTAASAGSGTHTAYTTLVQSVHVANIPGLIVGTNMAHAGLELDVMWHGPNGSVWIEGPASGINSGTSGGVYSYGYNSIGAHVGSPGHYRIIPASGYSEAVVAAGSGNAPKSINYTASTSVQVHSFEGHNSSPANNNTIYASYYLRNSNNVLEEIVRQSIIATDVTSGSEDGILRTAVVIGSALTNVLNLSGTALYPHTSGGLTLGLSTNPYGNVFLGATSKIDFGNGDVTITAASNALTFEGASSGYRFDDDLLLPSGGVINFNAGNITLTHAAGVLTIAAASTTPWVMSSGSQYISAKATSASGTGTYQQYENTSVSPSVTAILGMNTSGDITMQASNSVSYPNRGMIVQKGGGTDTWAQAQEWRASGDAGGAASQTTMTGTSNLTANSTGTGTIKFKGATNRDSSGFIKIYVGTTAYYVPVFSAITG